MEPEVDGPGAGPVPPRGLEHLRLERRVERLEAEDDEGALVHVVARAEREVGLDSTQLLVETCKNRDERDSNVKIGSFLKRKLSADGLE